MCLNELPCDLTQPDNCFMSEPAAFRGDASLLYPSLFEKGLSDLL